MAYTKVSSAICGICPSPAAESVEERKLMMRP